MTEEIIKEEFDKAFKKNFPDAIMIDGVDVAGCKHYDYCTTNECHIDFFRKCEGEDCYYKQLKRLEQELKWANDEEKYLKECCIKAGKELEKNSFAWDGKEKNLVVQALELNKRYEILKQENKELKEEIKKYSAINEQDTKDYAILRNVLEEIREVIYYCGYKDVVDKVLPKINEVL